MTNVYHVDFKSKKLISLDVFEKESSKRSLEKLAHFTKLIESGLTQVFVDSSVDNVILPIHIKVSLVCQMNWSHRFNIPDFEYDSKGIRGTLTFSKLPFYVNLPWSSIWIIHLPEKGKEFYKAWEKDAPPGFLKIIENQLYEERNT